jgi:hypothetical protein
MGSDGVVADAPSFDGASRLGKRREDVLVEPVVEAFNGRHLDSKARDGDRIDPTISR